MKAKFYILEVTSLDYYHKHGLKSFKLQQMCNMPSLSKILCQGKGHFKSFQWALKSDCGHYGRGIGVRGWGG